MADNLPEEVLVGVEEEASIAHSFPEDEATTVPETNNVEQRTNHGRGPTVDLRLLEYVSGFDRNLMCPVCHCPFVKAARLSCDHTFCEQCLHSAFRNQSQDIKTCPSCRRPTDPAEVLPVPRFLSHMIDELIVKCPKHGSGCQSQVRRGDVQNHVDHYCAYTEVTCPSQNCSLTIPKLLASAKCLHTILCCEYCQLTFMERDLQNHKDRDCTKKIVQCPSCQQETVQSRLKSHLQICDEVVVACAAATIGCPFSAKRIKTNQHAEQCVLVSLLPTLQGMTRRIEDQAATIQILQRRNAQLEDTLSTVKDYLEDTQSAGGVANFQSHAMPPAVEAATQSAIVPNEAPFDSATSHLLSLHESLREEVDRVAASVSELDARSSLMIMNETLRIKEDMAHTNGALGSLRMQLQWLTSARLQSQSRGMGTPSTMPGPNAVSATAGPEPSGNLQPRRLSDSSRQETKL